MKKIKMLICCRKPVLVKGHDKYGTLEYFKKTETMKL